MSATPSLCQPVASVHGCVIALERMKWQGWTIGYGLHAWLQWGQVTTQTKVQHWPGEGEGICDIQNSLLSQNYRRQHQWGSSAQESSLPPQDTLWTGDCPREDSVVPKHVHTGLFILTPTYSVITELKIHEVGNDSIYTGRHSQASRSKSCSRWGTTPKAHAEVTVYLLQTLPRGSVSFYVTIETSCSCERDGESFKASYSLSSSSPWQLAYPNIPDNLAWFSPRAS